MTDAHALEIRRSWFLVFAAWVVNVYVIGFATDATLSVLDDSLRIAGAGELLSGIRNGVAVVVAGATLPMLLAAIFVPQLPRAVLLPPIVFLSWTWLGAPPLPRAENGTAVLLGLSSAQLLLAANAFRIIRRRSGRWLLSAQRLPVIGHLWLRTAAALVLTVIFGAVAFAGLAAATIVGYLEAVTGGYMQFSATGMEMQETVLERGRTTVRLVATAHIAEPQFYKSLRASIPDDALVFVEGVTDRGGRMSGFSQRATAQAFGLSTQDVFNELLPPPRDEDAGGPGPDTGEPETTPDMPRVVRADVDAEVFSERAVGYLHDIDAISRSAGPRAALAAYMAFSRKYTEPEVTAIFEELIGQRNRHLLEAFDAQSADYHTIVIPWGAMHMPGLEKGLTDRHFHVVSRRVTPMARYDTILRHRMDD